MIEFTNIESDSYKYLYNELEIGDIIETDEGKKYKLIYKENNKLTFIPFDGLDNSKSML